jgi:Family of unknown function (DUF6228)/DinB superfamily
VHLENSSWASVKGKSTLKPTRIRPVLNKNEPVTPKLPVFPAEDHRCEACALRYEATSLDEVLVRIRTVPAELRELVADCEPGRLTAKPVPSEWSVVEYLCHVRDVFITSTIRLHRARTEEYPVLDPMLNDLRARRFRYNDWLVDAVLREIDLVATGFIDEVTRLVPSDFHRSANGPMGDRRTALWFARHALHEAVHHRNDIARLTANHRTTTVGSGGQILLAGPSGATVVIGDPEDPYRDGYNFVDFRVSITGDGLSATTNVRSVEGPNEGSLQRFFRELADDWKGNNPASQWESIEHDMTLEAQRDSLGHVLLKFHVRESYQPDAWTAQVIIQLDAGEEMSKLARDVEHLFRG